MPQTFPDLRIWLTPNTAPCATKRIYDVANNTSSGVPGQPLKDTTTPCAALLFEPGAALQQSINQSNEMLASLNFLFLGTVFAVPFPPPTGQYQVGITQKIFNHTTPHDPVAPQNAPSILLATIYYPTLSIAIPGNNTAEYLDPTTAKLWGDIMGYPNNSLQTLTTWNVYDAPPLDEATFGASQKPTVIFSPGGGENAILYNQLNAELASQGYTVLALDHPGEIPYLQLPDGREGIYGLDITAVWNASLQEAVYNMRVSDSLAIIRGLYPDFVAASGASWNTTNYLTVGHSIGGSASAKTMFLESSVLGAINLDGEFFDFPDVKKPLLMLAGAEHTDALDTTWHPFFANQTGWVQWVNVTGASHQDFSDLADWVDVQGLRNKTGTPSLGTIWGPRMDNIVRSFVLGFFDFVLGDAEWLKVPSAKFPEVVFINATSEASY
ncbi:hypothetical protein K504DRAFT_495975 [Pleomassaria siparia CBS 279.74]|uniref:1-alkyl-2-acetylglycerophosphocholine esterase n=1 Tax=Pleomassaria siparia CBS 279.74 TaxID=1314801 RepID=A0A6G1JQQ8_9PLEO|nr:hypothetical protein K504DRAFT_495975 [Pleomassaria siparia CBS 279.74]